jgi:hypothetical protein
MSIMRGGGVLMIIIVGAFIFRLLRREMKQTAQEAQ